MKRPRLKLFLTKIWFIIGIFFCVLISAIFPNFGATGGPLKPEYSVKYGAVSIIFFISGLSIKSNEFFYTLKQYRMHLFIQIYTFIFIPIMFGITSLILSTFNVNVWILKGLVTVACMPPPVSSAVILTKSAGGNEAIAVFNSVFGSLVGVILTPVLLFLTLRFATVVPIYETVVQLLLTVVWPVAVGSILVSDKFKRHFFNQIPLSLISQSALLFVIFSTFSDTFESHDFGLSASDILLTLVLVVVSQMILLFICFKLTVGVLKFQPSDVVAILFCSTHKSLTLGIPILRIMFEGYSHLSQISLPLLIYHPSQMIIGELISINLKIWLQKNTKKRIPI